MGCFLCDLLCLCAKRICAIICFISWALPLAIIFGLILLFLSVSSTDVEHALYLVQNSTEIGYLSESMADFITQNIWGVKYMDTLRNVSQQYTIDPDNPFFRGVNTTKNFFSSTSFLLKIISRVISPNTDKEVKVFMLAYMLPPGAVNYFILGFSTFLVVYIVVGILYNCVCAWKIFKHCCCCCCSRGKNGKSYKKVQTDNTMDDNNVEMLPNK